MMKRMVMALVGLMVVLPVPAQKIRVAFVGDPQVDNETELTYARRSIYKELRERARSAISFLISIRDIIRPSPAADG